MIIFSQVLPISLCTIHVWPEAVQWSTSKGVWTWRANVSSSSDAGSAASSFISSSARSISGCWYKTIVNTILSQSLSFFLKCLVVNKDSPLMDIFPTDFDPDDNWGQIVFHSYVDKVNEVICSRLKCVSECKIWRKPPHQDLFVWFKNTCMIGWKIQCHYTLGGSSFMLFTF